MTTKLQSTTQPRTWSGNRRAVAAGIVLMIAYALGFVAVDAIGMWANAALVAIVGGAAVFAICQRRRVDGSDASKTSAGEALLALGCSFLLARWGAGFEVEAYALVFLVIAWVVSTASARTAAAVVGLAVIVEASTHGLGTASALALGPEPVQQWTAIDLTVLGSRVGLMAAFAALAWMLVGRNGEERRRAYDREIEKERQRLLEEAREFRLIHAGRTESPVDRQEAEELIVRDAVDAVHHTVFVTLELVKKALEAHTVILLWFDLRNEELRIKELVSDSDEIVEGGIDPAGGVIGGITRRRDTVKLSGLRSGFRGLAYYIQSPEVTEFMGAPVIEQGHLRGVLCVDRNAQKPFDDEEAKIVEEAADYMMRAVENERMVASIERTRFEVGRFYAASRQLNGVLTPEEVYEVALDSVAQITDYDFAAITLYERDSDRHRVVHVDGEGAKSMADWAKVAFDSNRGLVSMVVNNQHYLPVGGQLRDRRATVITNAQDFSSLRSLLVLPLIVQDRAVGTMIIGHHESGEFPTQRREMLEVVANQVAVTMQNARLYSKMEEMAKFDGLTGLANRRSFESKLKQAMARHKRAGRTFGLVLIDIDHFKSVNDTYGHPVGDEVLRKVGAVFSEEMREIDVPARYGGEEFVLILEDTDLEGARQVADRIRVAISELEFQTDQGLLQCTISLGIAVGPWDSDEPHTLVDLADQALYHSKENGRNQVSVYREVVASGEAA